MKIGLLLRQATNLGRIGTVLSGLELGKISGPMPILQKISALMPISPKIFRGEHVQY